MAPVQISEVVDPEPAGPTPLEVVNARESYGGADLLADCKAAVRREVGDWGDKRQRRSDYERDALLQEVAVRVLADPLALARLGRADRPLRLATLRNDVRSLLRDSRGVLDSVIGWKPRPETRRVVNGKRTRARERVPVLESVREQADYAREREQELGQSRSRLSSLEELAERHTDETGWVDWSAVAGDQQREQEAEQPLPAVALAEHSRELSRLMADRLTATWSLTPRDRDRLEVALLIASGETVDRLTLALHRTVDQVKKASSAGRKILAARALDPAELVRLRRECVADLGLAEPEPEPDPLAALIAAAGAAVSRAERAERDTATVYLAGGGRTPTAEQPHGSPRDVLRFIDGLTRTLSQPVWSYPTSGARERPADVGERVLARATGPALPCWQPTGPERLSTSYRPTGTAAHARRCWPDRITAGQPHYSPASPPSQRERFGETVAAALATAKPQTLYGQRCPLPEREEQER